MNYSPVLEAQQKGKELGHEGIYLVSEILKRNILSINIRPGSFEYYKSFDTGRCFKFSGEREGKEINGIINRKEIDGIINITFKRNDLTFIDYIDLYIEGSAVKVKKNFEENMNIMFCESEKVKIRFDEKLNIIFCEVAVLNEDNNEIRFLNLEKAQDDFVKINYYDSDAVDLVKANTQSIIGEVCTEEAYAFNGVLPDRETDIKVGSQEELASIISTFLNDSEEAEKIYRGFSKKYPDVSNVLKEIDK